MFLGRVVKRGEPLWLDDDRSWALALFAHEDGTCDGCGHPLIETTQLRDGRHVHAYEVDPPDVCAGCAALTAELPEWENDARRPALKFRVTRTTREDGDPL